ncbi:hypothetical protein PPACK8108_LOCUS24987 [Phakopsora pachyrhizi]|uniref:Uncharacterized protein n=1 Tax=Phakopsora pachyrhizi TaxID=170000 RepID=A0AAV0BR16_PHAPC|nr:hypothetical protein PPACK8108_LOCUS24987 [Phakopsora pachyrhizi]
MSQKFWMSLPDHLEVSWCGGRFGLRRSPKEGAEGGFCWILLGFEEEGVAVEGNGWCHWKEDKKLGGGAHQGQSDWRKTTGAMEL